MPPEPLTEYLSWQRGLTLTDWQNHYRLCRMALHQALDELVDQHERGNPW